MLLLGLADFKYLGSAGRAYTLSSGSLVLHSNSFGILNLLLGPAFNTICFHASPPIDYEQYNILKLMSIGLKLFFLKKMQISSKIAGFLKKVRFYPSLPCVNRIDIICFE